MTSETPDWLNAEFMEKVLKKSENDDSIQVMGVATKPATAKGDNYASNMIRASVEYSRDISGRKIDKLGIFKSEIEMMETTLEQMNDLLNEENYRLSARVFYTQNGCPSFLVLEDLVALGFRMVDRQAGLDLHHAKLAIRGLAKFHASSVALVEKEPKITEMYNKGMCHLDHPKYLQSFFNNGFKSLAKEVHTWPELGPSYAEKIEKLSVYGYAKAAKCAEPSTDEFQVLNHGDAWINNMLFRYNDEGKATDHIFVDFQLPLWTSPAIDILYFLNTSLSNDVYNNHGDSLLQEYLNTLEETMSRIGCKTQAPSMAALKKSIKKREFYGVLSATVTLPFVLTDRSEVKSIDEILNEDGVYNNPAYRGALFRKAMIQRIPEWNARGLLDV